MLAALVLLAAVEAAPAAPAAPVIAASNGRTRTLADVARERKLGIKGVPGGTLSVAGAPVGRVVGQPARTNADGGLSLASPYDDWTARRDAVQSEVDAAQAGLGTADSTMPNVVCRRMTAACAAANVARESGLLPYRMKVSDAESKMEALRKEASRAGVPGLVR